MRYSARVSQRVQSATADELAAQGRMREAIQILTRANQECRDPEIESRLVELRRDTAMPTVPGGGRRRWPPKVRDRFRRVVGVPEVPADQLTPKLLRSGVLRHGCLLVRGLVGRSRVEQLVDDIDHAFDAYDAHTQGALVSETAPWFVPFRPAPGHTVPREWVRDGDGVVAVDSPRTLFDVIETFEEIGVRDLLTSYLGEPPLLLANKWTLRRVSPGPDGRLDWHQDGAFLGADICSVDIWLSLSHCGLDAPGLDVVARRFESVVEVGTNGAALDWTVSEDTVRQIAPGQVVRPVFEPGDALIFDHLLLHRTAYDPAMTRDRYAIEAWFAAPSRYPPTAIPIAY